MGYISKVDEKRTVLAVKMVKNHCRDSILLPLNAINHVADSLYKAPHWESPLDIHCVMEVSLNLRPVIDCPLVRVAKQRPCLPAEEHYRVTWHQLNPIPGTLREINLILGILRKLNPILGILREINPILGILREINPILGILREINPILGILREINPILGILREINPILGLLREIACLGACVVS